MPWLLVIAALLIYEAVALATGRRTLSRMVWDATRRWPILPFVIGLGCGGLAVHFWWHWCP